MYLAPHSVDPDIIVSMPQTVRLGIMMTSRTHIWSILFLLGRNRCGENLAASGTTTLNESFAVLALHPLTETMSSFATNSAWLIGSFAHDTLYLLLYIPDSEVKRSFNHKTKTLSST